jgi:glutaconate CoA-transferase subunit A
MGIPSIPVRGIWGTDLLEVGIQNGNYRVIKDPFTGEDLVAVRAIEPDVTLIHAQRANVFGDAEIWGSRFTDVLKARAAKKVIVSAEEIVDHEMMKLEPDKTVLPYFYVDAVVHLPNGAYPTACYGLYDVDYQHVKEYLHMSRDGKFQEYLDNYVYRKGS